MSTDLTTLDISLVLPPSDEPIDFDNLNCNAVGTEISLVEDSELHVKTPVQVIEVVGQDTKLIFYPDCQRPYLVMHLRSMKRFLSFKITCEDSKRGSKTFMASNKQSFITIEDDICRMPLQIGTGWQYICLDLVDMMANAFGSTYTKCIEIEISGSCRIGKIYFQSKQYADIELPDYLRVVKQ